MKPKHTACRARLWPGLVLALFLPVLAAIDLKADVGTFSNPAQIATPLVGPASTYPSIIQVGNLPGTIVSVNVTLIGVTHPVPDDLDILLVGPDGQAVLLMSDAGGSNPISTVTLGFSDGATAVLPDSGRINGGIYLPTNYGTGDQFPGIPAVTGFASKLSVFAGGNPNGAWQLYVVDDESPNAGLIAGGWRLEINTAAIPPTVSKEPEDVAVPLGSAATFHVEVRGTPPFGFQWMHDGQVVVPFGQGTDTLTIPAVKPADAGGYSVLITNGTGAAGAVLSRTALLQPIGPLEVRIFPQDALVSPGDSVTFSARLVGTPPFRFQWTLNGAVLPDETNASLALPQVRADGGGHYAVVVWTDTEAFKSPPALLLVRGVTAAAPADAFQARPTFKTLQGLLQGDSSNFTVEPGERVLPGGGRSAWFEWIAPESGVVKFSTRGSSFDTLLGVFKFDPTAGNGLAPVTRDDDGGPGYTSLVEFNAQAGTAYEIVVDGFGVGGAGGQFTVSWALTVGEPPVPVIVEPPVSRAVPVGKEASFRVITESADDTFQWFRNGQPLPGENQAFLRIPNAASADVGVYRVGIANALGRIVLSAPFELQVGAPGLKLVEDKFESMLMSSGNSGFLSIGLGNSFFSEVPADASHGEGDPTPCGGPFFGTLWQGLTATNTGVIQVDTTGSFVPTRMAVYRLTGGIEDFSAPPIICDLTSASNGVPAVAKFDATNGTNYTIVVEGLGVGNITLTSKMGIAPLLTTPVEYCLVAQDGGIVLSMPATNWCPLPACRWRLNGVPIPDATNATLLVTNFNLAKAGTYSVVMSNFVRVAVRDVAVLSLAGPFRLGYEWIGGEGSSPFKIAASNAAPFVLQTASAITGPWTPVATNPDPCLVLFYTNASPWLDSQRFFRGAPWPSP